MGANVLLDGPTKVSIIGIPLPFILSLGSSSSKTIEKVYRNKIPLCSLVALHLKHKPMWYDSLPSIGIKGLRYT